MNNLTTIQAESLPSLIDRASRALASARSSGEVLEARDLAHVAYDAAKSAGRMARAKKAHDDVIGAVYRAQADALMIEARAKMRLADEYDAAQDRGEIAKVGQPSIVATPNDTSPITAADLGIRRDEIHEARKLRDAEREQPGLIQQALQAMVAPKPTVDNPNPRPVEPTRAALQRSVVAAIADAKQPENRRNPDYRPNPDNDAVLAFTDHCLQLAAAVPDRLANWNHRDTTRARMISAARRAQPVLERFLKLIGDEHA